MPAHLRAGAVRPLAAALVACLALPVVARAESQLTQVGQEVALGSNLNDEACRLRLTATAPNEGDRKNYSIYCEGWTRPSGTMASFRGRQLTPKDFLTTGPFADMMATRVAECSAASESKIADKYEGAVRFCRRRDGGWPTVLGAAKIGERMYRFETLPTNVPLAERAIEALASDQAIVIKVAPHTALIAQYEAAAHAAANQFGAGTIGAEQNWAKVGEESIFAARHADAERAWRSAGEILERLFGPKHPELGRPLTWMALAVFRQGRVTEAAALQKRAEPLTKESRNRDDYPEWLTYQSYIEQRLGHQETALALAKQAYDIRRGLFPKGGGAIGHSGIVLARTYNAQRQYQNALAAAEDAVRNYSQAYGESHPMIGWSWDEEANAYLGLGDLAHAREAAERALKLHAYLYGDGEAVFQDAQLVGRIAARDHRSADAIAAFQHAIKAASTSSLIEVRPAPWITDYLDLLAAGAGGGADAFAAAQLVRGGVTDDAIRAMATRAAADDPAIGEVVRKLQDAESRKVGLRGRIAEEERLPDEERQPGTVEKLKAALAAADSEAGEAEQRLQAQFPRYAKLVRPGAVPADAAAKLLKPNEAILVAITTPSATHVLLLRNGKVAVNKAPLGTKELTAQIAALRKTLEPDDAGLPAFDVAGARRLYDSLLRPLSKELAGVDHLIVASSGPLLSLPLGLLVRDTGAAQPAYLARDMAFSVVPTVAAFRDLRQAAAAAAGPKPFLWIGDPDFTGKAGDRRGLNALSRGCRADQGVDLAAVRALPRLAETANELRGIATALKAAPDSLVLGDKATKSGLRTANLAQYRVVAFATHGLLADELDCQNEPALALSLPPGAKSGADGLLSASEIVDLHLNADWILLSACNTAGPEGLAGEALSGLTRAFFYAGARSVMATHWPVESTATVRLTTTTFETYAKQPKRGKAQALRTAQLALMNDPQTAHPIFWAPFVLVGDGG